MCDQQKKADIIASAKLAITDYIKQAMIHAKYHFKIPDSQVIDIDALAAKVSDELFTRSVYSDDLPETSIFLDTYEVLRCDHFYKCECEACSFETICHAPFCDVKTIGRVHRDMCDTLGECAKTLIYEAPFAHKYKSLNLLVHAQTLTVHRFIADETQRLLTGQ